VNVVHLAATGSLVGDGSLHRLALGLRVGSKIGDLGLIAVGVRQDKRHRYSLDAL